MLSGRLAGMAVRPLPLQSTMLLLQVHMAGQEPPPTMHGCGLEESWCPGEKCREEIKTICEKAEKCDERSQMRRTYRCVSTGGFDCFLNESSMTLCWITGCDCLLEDLCGETEQQLHPREALLLLFTAQTFRELHNELQMNTLSQGYFDNAKERNEKPHS